MDGFDFGSLFGSSSLDGGFNDFTSSMDNSQILGFTGDTGSADFAIGSDALAGSSAQGFQDATSGISDGVGTGSIDGSMSGSDFASQFGNSNTAGTLGISALRAVGQAASAALKGGSGSGRGNGGMLTSSYPLPGHMYMRTHETPDAYKAKAVQSEDPRQIWMKWYTDMQNFAYKGK